MLIVALAFLLGGIADPTTVTDHLTREEVSRLGSLELRLEAAKPEFVLYEPVEVKFTLTNPTNESITSNALMDASAGGIRFFIAFADGGFQEYVGLQRKDVVAGEIIHAPGSVMVGKTDLRKVLERGTSRQA